jgi:nicotinate-nucleotide adenylyltransferase|tara:strand:- start:2277 stop:2804 length:528 start_codon:yes stop_codon:yes gene_type:complete
LKNKKLNKIGILGGTFDPAHKGHIAISKEAIRSYKISKVIWAVTKKNPFKKKSYMTLKERIIYARIINKNNPRIKVNYYEDKIKSSRTINLINYIKKNNKNSQLFFLMGADNLINFHKWHKWKLISKKCIILVFDRNGYKAKSMKSKTFKQLNQKELSYIKFKKVNISSSQLRKI